MIRHFVDLFDLSAADRPRPARAARSSSKRDDQRGHRPPLLSGRTLGLIFEKPSLRTRVSFEAAIAQLGGNAIFLRGKDVGLGVRESVADFARVISQYVDVLAVRTFSHATIEELARYATIPIINALSDAAHPCQAMADLMTIQERSGRLDGVKLVFVGDGNNVARSLALASALLGPGVRPGVAPPATSSRPSSAPGSRRRFPGVPLVVEHDPRQAVVGRRRRLHRRLGEHGPGARGRERRAGVRSRSRSTTALLDRAGPDAIFLHCLPAHRGEEVTSDVLDGPRSRVIPQAANRLHFQKALLLWLLLETWPEGLTANASAGLATDPRLRDGRLRRSRRRPTRPPLHDPTRRPSPRRTPTRADRARIRPQQPRQRALPRRRRRPCW